MLRKFKPKKKYPLHHNETDNPHTKRKKKPSKEKYRKPKQWLDDINFDTTLEWEQEMDLLSSSED